MDELEKPHPDQTSAFSKQESETPDNQPRVPDASAAPESPERPSRTAYEKTPEERQRIAEILDEARAANHETSSGEHVSDPTANPVETVVKNGRRYTVEYVPKESIYPAFGYGGGDHARVRNDLPPRVKKFVKEHELYHCRDRATWGGELGSEIRANIIPGLKDPIGLAATIWKTVADKDRMRFYLNRLRRGQ